MCFGNSSVYTYIFIFLKSLSQGYKDFAETVNAIILYLIISSINKRQIWFKFRKFFIPKNMIKTFILKKIRKEAFVLNTEAVIIIKVIKKPGFEPAVL
jgi:hypothetical protein